MIKTCLRIEETLPFPLDRVLECIYHTLMGTKNQVSAWNVHYQGREHMRVGLIQYAIKDLQQNTDQTAGTLVDDTFQGFAEFLACIFGHTGEFAGQFFAD